MARPCVAKIPEGRGSAISHRTFSRKTDTRLRLAVEPTYGDSPPMRCYVRDQRKRFVVDRKSQWRRFSRVLDTNNAFEGWQGGNDTDMVRSETGGPDHVSNNRAQNREFRDATRGLTNAQKERIRREVEVRKQQHERFDYHRIRELREELFGQGDAKVR
jgi:hypothetical protein